MSLNESSYEHTRIINDATEMVVRLTKRGEDRREEIAKVVCRLADQITYSAAALANLTLMELAETGRKSG